MRVFATAYNLYTWTNYNGWDPEVMYAGTNRTQTNTILIPTLDFIDKLYLFSFAVVNNFLYMYPGGVDDRNIKIAVFF